jgi:hypothetical protein
MPRIRLSALGTGAALLAAWLLAVQPAGGPVMERLDGDWEVVSVRRDGVDDSAQVGARLMFSGGEVRFEPKAPAILDGTS